MTSERANEELIELARRLPLAESWAEPRCYSERVTIGALDLCVVGLVASSGVLEATGSAAQPGQYPWQRAYHELLERAVLLDAIERRQQVYEVRDATGRATREVLGHRVFPESPTGASWRYARSNGTAVRIDWAEACYAARAEVVERHRVLSCWFGWATPERVEECVTGFEKLGLPYDFQAFRFPAGEMTGRDELEVFGFFGFPLRAGAPLVYGFGAGCDASSAAGHASRECLQRLGFLWGESIPTEEPRLEPSASYHQELFLWPPMLARVKAWLRAGHAARIRQKPESALGDIGYVDLTPPHLLGRVCVVKAVAETELPLTFGRGYPSLEEAEALVGVHPIV